MGSQRSASAPSMRRVPSHICGSRRVGLWTILQILAVSGTVPVGMQSTPSRTFRKVDLPARVRRLV